MGGVSSQAAVVEPETPADVVTSPSLTRPFSAAEIDARACGRAAGANESISTSGVDDSLEAAPTILLLGPTGAGKSSLINAAFGLKGPSRAPTRAGGAPCTDTFRVYGGSSDMPACLIDSRGLERADAAAQRAAALRYVHRCNSSTQVGSHIALTWYIVGDRWETADADVIRALRDVAVPVVVVVSRCDMSARLQKDASTGRRAMDMLADVIQQDFPSLPIVFCGNISTDTGSKIGFVPPDACDNGHAGDEWFVVDRATAQWRCDYPQPDGDVCGLSGECEPPAPFGVRELLEASRVASATGAGCHSVAAQRAFIAAQRALLETRRAAASRIIARAFYASLAAGTSGDAVETEQQLASDLFNAYDVPYISLEPGTLRRATAALVSGGRGAISPDTVRWWKQWRIVYHIGILLEAFVKALAVQSVAIAIVVAIEKLYFTASAVPGDSKDGCETNNAANCSSDIDPQQFSAAVLDICATQDINDMSKERQFLVRRMGAVDENLRKRLERLSHQVESAISTSMSNPSG